jgi:hypothetical protein
MIEMSFVGSVITALDRGTWVAGINILSINFESLLYVVKDCD